MNKRPYIGLAVLVTALIVFLPMLAPRTSHVFAAQTVDLASTSRAAVLLDSATGKVVFEKNPKERLQIASMVKIMTLGVAFDEIEKRGISTDTNVTVSANAASMGGSQAFLEANGVYRLDELLKSIVVASANDSCVAVAEFLYGSADAFVAEMNSRAQEWGMLDTAFSNCTGLPKDGQYCCAADVAVMFKKLIAHEKFFDYAKVWMYDIEHPGGRTTQLTNTNKLVRFYDGCDGGKTGYTDAARSCITVTAKRGDTRLICVAIGAQDSKTRNKEVSEMLNYGFANYKTVYTLHSGDKVGTFDVQNGKTDCIDVAASCDHSIFVKTGEKCDVELEPHISALYAPIKAGDVVGSIVIKVNGESVAEIDAVSKEECEKRGYMDIVDDFIENW